MSKKYFPSSTDLLRMLTRAEYICETALAEFMICTRVTTYINPNLMETEFLILEESLDNLALATKVTLNNS